MITSPRKVAKKASQVFRRNQADLMERMLKPKPKWVPWKIYLWLLGLFIRIDKDE